MLEPVLIAGMEQGGQLMITTDVENYPGYAETVQGPWMMEQMLKQGHSFCIAPLAGIEHTQAPVGMRGLGIERAGVAQELFGLR